MPKKGVIYLFIIISAALPITLSASKKPKHPKVTLVIIVDQLAYHQMNKQNVILSMVLGFFSNMVTTIPKQITHTPLRLPVLDMLL